jgi:hypothetical protein
MNATVDNFQVRWQPQDGAAAVPNIYWCGLQTPSIVLSFVVRYGT